MTIDLTPERAFELLREVVAEYGAEHVYNKQRALDGRPVCRYVHGDEPGCIAGQVYHRAGLSLGQLSSLEGKTAKFEGFYDMGVEPKAAHLLREAQVLQDQGYTWGAALAAGARYYARYLGEVA